MAKYLYHRLDANHAEIRNGLEQAGASVSPSGPCDLLVGFRGQTYVFEVKTAKGKLRPKQKRFLAGWKGSAHVVRTLDEALRAIGAIQ
jgi:hypothetical protein